MNTLSDCAQHTEAMAIKNGNTCRPANKMRMAGQRASKSINELSSQRLCKDERQCPSLGPQPQGRPGKLKGE